MKGVSFNVTLSEEQMDEIAAKTADKVLQTKSRLMTDEEILRDEIRELKQQLKIRDELIVKNELLHQRVKNTLRMRSNKLQQYEEKYGKLK